MATTRRELLERCRDELVAAIEKCRYQKDLPPLVHQLRMTLADLDGIPAENADTPTDEIARRREERRRKASGE